MFRDTYDTQIPRLIFLSELRRICGVSQSAISNWSSRWPDFPQPLHEAGRQAVYDRDEVYEWLITHGKLHTTEVTP